MPMLLIMQLCFDADIPLWRHSHDEGNVVPKHPRPCGKEALKGHNLRLEVAVHDLAYLALVLSGLIAELALGHIAQADDLPHGVAGLFR